MSLLVLIYVTYHMFGMSQLVPINYSHEYHEPGSPQSTKPMFVMSLLVTNQLITCLL